MLYAYYICVVGGNIGYMNTQGTSSPGMTTLGLIEFHGFIQYIRHIVVTLRVISYPVLFLARLLDQ